ncbi:tRNA preQ1(34) S-adenosylmethionine ribosyltransferase-isomerase QueA [Sphingomonas sp.]|uniref:tRNA preQ1(34) S-adenosylmethionine ribosyltransferase-isomerase QueA n=1 Tax=Sphingomonas sp. TaxID=28214 RepID=UPI00338EFB84
MGDRLFWTLLRRLWSHWDRSLVVVKPDTVIEWHRQGFKLLWRRRSRSCKVGRPRIPREHINFIRSMSSDHPEWGEDKIAEELAAKFGIEHSTSTIRRYMVPRRNAPRGDQNWRAFIRNARRLRDGDEIDFGSGVTAYARDRGEDGSFALDFAGEEPVELLLERAGRMPLPPYIAARRPADAQDADDYQTMFAAEKGAVAAPTAALHFTPALMAKLGEAGIEHATLTLHVGAGTFLPVKADDTLDHKMHAEWGRIDAATADRLNAVRARGGRVIAVGTTSLRLIESATGADGVIRPFEGDTAIFITPGYRFNGIDGLVTNFHLPRSTLFMLVSALMGTEQMQTAYAHAVRDGYRFYSYGDASLLLPTKET